MLGTVRGAAAGVVSTSAEPLLAPSECGLSHADAGPMEKTMKNAAAHVARTHRVMSVRRSTEAANGRSVFAMLHPPPGIPMWQDTMFPRASPTRTGDAPVAEGLLCAGSHFARPQTKSPPRTRAGQRGGWKLEN